MPQMLTVGCHGRHDLLPQGSGVTDQPGSLPWSPGRSSQPHHCWSGCGPAHGFSTGVQGVPAAGRRQRSRPCLKVWAPDCIYKLQCMLYCSLQPSTIADFARTGHTLLCQVEFALREYTHFQQLLQHDTDLAALALSRSVNNNVIHTVGVLGLSLALFFSVICTAAVDCVQADKELKHHDWPSVQCVIKLLTWLQIQGRCILWASELRPTWSSHAVYLP